MAVRLWFCQSAYVGACVARQMVRRQGYLADYLAGCVCLGMRDLPDARLAEGWLSGSAVVRMPRHTQHDATWQNLR